MNSIVLTTSPDRSSVMTTLRVFWMLSNANDKATALGVFGSGAVPVEVEDVVGAT